MGGTGGAEGLAMMRVVLGAVVGVLAVVAIEGAALACSPPGDNVGTAQLNSVTPIVTDHLAKNVGIPLQLSAYGPLTADFVRTHLTVTVRANGAEVAGALEPLATEDVPQYRWKPASGDTPTGALSVSFAIVGDGATAASPTVANQAPTTATITVEDRVAVAQPTGATIALERDIVEDTNAPQIVCTRTRGIGECGSGDATSNISTRWVGVPDVAATLAPVASPDQPLVQIATEIYGQDASGVKGPLPTFAYTDLTNGQPSVAHGRLDRAYAQYCVTTTTSILGLAASASTTVCASPKVDLAVSDDEAVSKIHEQTAGCDSTKYPAGTSEDDPTGNGGCSTSPNAATPTGTLALAALVLVAIRRRRCRSCDRG